MGGIPVAGGRVVKRGLFFRGGALNAVTEADKEKLRDLGIVCAIDLRTGWEREAKPDKEIPGIENLHIPFFDKEIVGIEYEKPISESIVDGHDFACDPSDFYRAMPNPLTARQMRQALEVVFDHAMAGEATLQHCSGGKDRTGVLALLTLTILGADKDAILQDYLETNIARDANIQPIYERFLRLTGDEEVARRVTDDHRARPSNLENFYEALDENFGNMNDFIHNHLGIDNDRMQAIRACCTEER